MRRGLTLVEVLVVIGIVGVLATTLTVIVAPAAKRGGYETRIRSDMRQIVGAINIYMGDNDGHYPLGKRSLPDNLPWRFKGLDSQNGPSPYGPFQGTASYFYTYPCPVQAWERIYDFDVKFDPATEPILTANFLPKRFAPYRYEYYWVGPTRNPKPLRVEDWRHLMARLDGSVRWFPTTTWQSIARGHGSMPYPSVCLPPKRPR